MSQHGREVRPPEALSGMLSQARNLGEAAEGANGPACAANLQREPDGNRTVRQNFNLRTMRSTNTTGPNT
ncbi:hypothetical protein [Cognatilysobacter lacus]|uniref:Uncharacterized protein n=1 Tax=Cognatilysobacter lacus TaxID=1643323 RepID=A0A5D8YZ72_9GAMM|nr:hypothetical protein [Lysobacter lacus]TZF87779.1 hypothetical protein FW784_10670 [Lysobacter lacus]